MSSSCTSPSYVVYINIIICEKWAWQTVGLFGWMNLELLHLLWQVIKNIG